jgi:hypothetical protein
MLGDGRESPAIHNPILDGKAGLPLPQDIHGHKGIVHFVRFTGHVHPNIKFHVDIPHWAAIASAIP